MKCPCCDSEAVVASLTDNLHAGRADCHSCNRMVKWLSPEEIDYLGLELQLVSDINSTSFWNDFLSMLPSVENSLLSSFALRVGLFGDSLIIVLNLSSDCDAFQEADCALPCFARILSTLFDRAMSVEVVSVDDWRMARSRTAWYFSDVIKANYIPIELIFGYYYCQSIDITGIRSNQWMCARIDELMLISRKKGYKPGWVLNFLTTRYHLSLDAFKYLARSFDYHPDWAAINYRKYSHVFLG